MSFSIIIMYNKELRAILAHPIRPKMKFAFHQIFLISLLEQWPKCISLILV